MTKDEALKLALEALESVTKHFTRAQSTLRDSEVRGEAHKAITALRKALAYPQQDRPQNCGTGYCSCIECVMEPQQEPFEYWNAVEGWVKIDEVRQHFDSVGCGTIYKTAGEDRVPLYTTPPKRNPLSDEQLEKVFPVIATYHESNKTLYRSIARAIEAAHGIKGDRNEA